MKGWHLHVGLRTETNPTTGFDAMDKEQRPVVGDEREIWLEREQDDLLDVDDASIFYGDLPPRPDFPCVSSSSSSSSTPASFKTIASSSSSSSASLSSSAASWPVLKSDIEEDLVEKRNHVHHHHNYEYHNISQHDPLDAPAADLSSSGGYMEIPQPSDQAIERVDCMETFGLESNDFFDPSSIFHPDENLQGEFQIEKKQPEHEQLQQGNDQKMLQSENEETTQQLGGIGGGATDDLAMVFIEWLKINKETVSAEDLRRVKIKKATIECAARRLGGGKEAMKKLLKLILEWVQTNHLQRRRTRESSRNNLLFQCNDPLENPNPCNLGPKPTINCNSIVPPDQSNHCFAQSPWSPPQPYVADQSTIVSGSPPMFGHMGYLFANGGSNMNGHPSPILPDNYLMLESSLASHYPSFTDNNLQSGLPQPPAITGYGNQYPYHYVAGHGEGLVNLGSWAAKEARKKRMARHRRFFSNQRNHNHHNNEQNQHPNQSADPHTRLGKHNAPPTAQAKTGNWVYWHTGTGAAPSTTTVLPVNAQQVHPVDRPAMQAQNYQRQLAPDRRQGWKPEKNLMFLLQKVLKQSDVGTLGRIVLPKREAETHLPELETRDGISIAMEDTGTSRVWNMRYRFWPNNKSRMYLLENTGDFVRTNGLQEGDFIVIYLDVKCGKYLIRGVKVRHPGPKSESRRAGKSQKNLHANCPAAVDGSPSATPITHPAQTVK